MRDYEAEERLRMSQRERKRAQMRRIRQRRARRQRILVIFSLFLGVILLFAAGSALSARKAATEDDDSQEVSLNTDAEDVSQEEETPEVSSIPEAAVEETEEDEAVELPFASGYTFSSTDDTVYMGSESVTSSYAILVDLDNNTVVAQRNASTRISPASMTKILTVLVAAEHIDDLDDTFTITTEITDYSYSNDCSAAGFDDGETVTVQDLFYGTILPSGADAAAGLAFYVAGSLEDFVELMNDKLQELGLSDSAHFTNCVGLYDENHYCTVYDMAVILKAAEENELCREVLSTRIYTTSSTAQHPDGIELSNWFLRRIEDKDTLGEVAGAKTGYVVQSGNCAASYEITDTGKHYICVTADAHSSWRCIYDHVAVYQEYTE